MNLLQHFRVHASNSFNAKGDQVSLAPIKGRVEGFDEAKAYGLRSVAQVEDRRNDDRRRVFEAIRSSDFGWLTGFVGKGGLPLTLSDMPSGDLMLRLSPEAKNLWAKAVRGAVSLAEFEPWSSRLAKAVEAHGFPCRTVRDPDGEDAVLVLTAW